MRVARRLRLFGKKRGQRRTGSQRLGSLGLAAFFAAFFVGGWTLLIFMLVAYILPDWRANRRFVRGECEVLDKQVRAKETEEGTLYRPEVRIRYRVGERTLQTWTYAVLNLHDVAYTPGRTDKEEALARFIVGERYPVWYDPLDPRQAVLVRGYTYGVWAMLLVPVAFIVVGGRGLAFWLFDTGKSTERRAALAQQAQRAMRVELFDPAAASRDKLPNVPSDGDLTNSPGTRLAYRLPMVRSPAWPLAIVGAGVLVWNVMIALFAAVAIDRHFRGEPDWFLTATVIPAAAGGAALVHYFFRQLVRYAGIGPTLVEISDHPLYPGRPFRACVSQAGRLSMRAFEVLLVCEERATYHQGTNTRTDAQRVYQRQLLRREGFEIEPDEPFEVETELRVPADGMHSFAAQHNEVSWKLVVRGAVEGWADFQREFPLAVHPPAALTAGKP
jgi:hypothetical protein